MPFMTGLWFPDVVNEIVQSYEVADVKEMF